MARSLSAADPRANLRPLHEQPRAAGAFGAAGGPAWFMADLRDTTGPSPWDLAHSRVADQLGISESDVIFAEPDLPQGFLDNGQAGSEGMAFAAAPPDCKPIPQDSSHNRAAGPNRFAWHLENDRGKLFFDTRDQRLALHKTLEGIFERTPNFAPTLGLDPSRNFEVHELRRSIRVRPDGRYVQQIIASLTQARRIQVDGTAEPQPFYGGSTLIIDLAKPAVQYAIFKRIDSKNRQERTTEFLKEALQDPLRSLLFGPDRREPFAALHT